MKKKSTHQQKPYENELGELITAMGKRMQQLRKESGYTNYELFAFENELPRAQYGRYERGQDLKISSLLKVIRGYGISIQEFFGEGFE
jgi:transcriptional regulator with XRE-family HTH domain